MTQGRQFLTSSEVFEAKIKSKWLVIKIPRVITVLRIEKSQILFARRTDEDLMPEGTKIRRISFYLKSKDERQ